MPAIRAHYLLYLGSEMFYKMLFLSFVSLIVVKMVFC